MINYKKSRSSNSNVSMLGKIEVSMKTAKESKFRYFEFEARTALITTFTSYFRTLMLQKRQLNLFINY